MRTLLLLTLLLDLASSAVANAEALPAEVARAIQSAAGPGVRVEAQDFRIPSDPGCRVKAAVLDHRLTRSELLAVRIKGTHADGEACEVTGWVRLRAYRAVLVTANKIEAGQPLAPSVHSEEREWKGGLPPVVQLPEGAVAARPLMAGTPLALSSIREAGPNNGATVRVLLRHGPIELEAEGRAVPCIKGHACALLASGRRVEGVWSDGRIVWEVP